MAIVAGKLQVGASCADEQVDHLSSPDVAVRCMQIPVEKVHLAHVDCPAPMQHSPARDWEPQRCCLTHSRKSDSGPYSVTKGLIWFGPLWSCCCSTGRRLSHHSCDSPVCARISLRLRTSTHSSAVAHGGHICQQLSALSRLRLRVPRALLLPAAFSFVVFC